VRDTVDLKLVLGRLEQLRWNVRDLVDYLTKQQPSFTPADWYKPPPTTDCSSLVNTTLLLSLIVVPMEC
jgi:hypothetical protein